jgi:hypothetical protein
MSRRLLIGSAISCALFVSCRDATGVNGPPPNDATPQVEVFLAVTPISMLGAPNSAVPALPTVHLYTQPNLKDVVGAKVTFSLTGPDGQTGSYTTTTDPHGIASLNAWRTGSAWGQYQVTARTAGATNELQFTTRVRAPVTATYDLVSISGNKLPYENETEGHIVLYADGSYSQVYNRPAGDTGPNDGTYFQPSPGVFQFFWAAGVVVTSAEYVEGHGLLMAVGTVDGPQMKLDYWDTFDYEPEVYVAR